MKKTKRKGFNFFRSYYDVYNMLETDKDKLEFIEALLDKQFLGVDPKGLQGMVKFAWISQINSIDSQVKGYEDKTKTMLDGTPYIRDKNTPTKGGTQGGSDTPTEQVEEKGEEKEEVKEKDIPTFEVFKSFALEKTERLKRKLNNDLLKLKYDAWVENDWKDGNDNPIKNWKTKLLNTLQYLSEEKQKTGYKI